MNFNPTEFYDRLRRGKLLGSDSKLDTGEFNGTRAILEKAQARNLKVADLSYILATAYHEVNGTMQPIKEYGGTGYFTRMYDIKGSRPTLAKKEGNIHPGDGAKFFGRGLVQLTWRGNYRRVGQLIGVDLENNPDLALDLGIAVTIAVDGMMHGWFTSHKLSHHLPRNGLATREQFKNARRIINGMDKADKIAGYALQFQSDLVAAGWPQ